MYSGGEKWIQKGCFLAGISRDEYELLGNGKQKNIVFNAINNFSQAYTTEDGKGYVVHKGKRYDFKPMPMQSLDTVKNCESVQAMYPNQTEKQAVWIIAYLILEQNAADFDGGAWDKLGNELMDSLSAQDLIDVERFFLSKGNALKRNSLMYLIRKINKLTKGLQEQAKRGDSGTGWLSRLRRKMHGLYLASLRKLVAIRYYIIKNS